MEEYNMRKSSRESGKSHAISHCKEGAEVDWTKSGISLPIKAKIGINNGRDVIFGAISGVELIREYGEGFSTIDIEPVAQGCHEIHN